MSFDTSSAFTSSTPDAKLAEDSVTSVIPSLPDRVADQLAAKWDLELYLCYFPQMNEAGRRYLRAAIEAPSRNPNGSRSNTTRYPSLKTRQTFTCESDAELPAALMADHTDDVLFFVEQPPRAVLQYAAGHSTATSYTIPDAVFFFREGPVVIEIKRKASLAKKAILQKYRYQRHSDGKVRSEPAERAFAAYGLKYRILTEDDFPGLFVRNLNLLSPYFRADLREPVTDDERRLILDAVKSDPGITTLKLPIANASRRADLVYSLLAHREIFAHLSLVDARALEKLRLFDSPLQEKAFAVFAGKEMPRVDRATPIAGQFRVGTEFSIGRVRFSVMGHRPDGILALNQKTQVEEEISFVGLHEADVRIVRTESSMATDDLLASLDQSRLQSFLKNRRMIAPYLPSGKHAGESPKNRHTRRLLRCYRLAQAASGVGERGLISRVKDRGNREPRKPASEDLLQELIDAEFKTANAPSASFVFQLYLSAANERNIVPADRYTYRTVAKRIAAMDKYFTALARLGKRGALNQRPPQTAKSLIGPPNGMAPMAVGHIDHTLMDALVEDPTMPGVFRRPWISAMVDGYDGRILAFVIWFGHPDTNIVLELHKECIRRHGVLPSKIRCDWGSEFRSTAVQTALADLGISLSYRPKGEPRSGSPIETSFRTMNVRVLHNAAGNVKILKKAREATAAVQPENFACWDYAGFVVEIEDYIATHNQAPRAHKLSPNEMYAAFVARHGSHWGSWLSAELIDRLCRIPVLQNTRIVSKCATIRVRSANYTADELRALIGQEVRVYFNRKDPRSVFIDDPNSGRQVECMAASNPLIYADSAAEAEAMVDARMAGSYRRIQDSHALFAGLAARTRRREADLKACENDCAGTVTTLPPAVRSTVNDAEIIDINAIEAATFPEE